MDTPPIVSEQEWEKARQDLLVKEKEVTRAQDALAAERRRMPWRFVEKEYEFEGPEGRVMRSGTNQQLITAVRDAYENIGRWPVERTGEPAFPDCSAHLITATDLLIRRARLPAIMFRFDQDPDAMQTITSLNGDLPQSNQASARAVWPLRYWQSLIRPSLARLPNYVGVHAKAVTSCAARGTSVRQGLGCKRC
jgi:hypothetical protein